MSVLMQCQGCGGSVVYDAARETAACLFCGADKLQQCTEEDIPLPKSVIPQAINRTTAKKQYEEWATSSWWYPKALRQLSVELTPMYLPAWHFQGEVETHWAGLISAATNSGKRPVSGSDTRNLQHVIPASQGLTEQELDELLPFDSDVASEWNPENAMIPYEVPGMSEQQAKSELHSVMVDIHRSLIVHDNDLIECRATAMVREAQATLYMLPVFIGAFRFRNQPWRFLVNAQTGEVVGDAPFDRLKIAMVSLGTALAFSVVYLILQ